VTAPAVIVADAMLSGLPSAANAYVTAPAVGVAVAVKSGVALALPSATAVPTVATPLAVPIVAGAVQPVIWPSEIARIVSYSGWANKNRLP